MLDLEALDVWLTVQGIERPFFYGGLPDDTGRGAGPARLHALIETPGLPMTVERAYDRPTLQVLTRGANDREAKEAAWAVHDAIVDAEIPFDLGNPGKRVIDTGRVGGGPAQVGTDDKRRVYYSCNYRFEIAR